MGPKFGHPRTGRGTNPQVMAWIMDTYSMHRGYSVPAVVTGKPVEHPAGPRKGRYDAHRGMGVMFIARCEALRHLDIAIDGSTVVVQGFGNVGATATRCTLPAWAPMVAVSDVTGGI